MSCDSISNLISLYYYGELTPVEEDRVEEHISACTGCATEMERHRKMAAALERRIAPVPAALLQDCRADLMAAVQGGAPYLARSSKGPWGLFLDAVRSSFQSLGAARQPLSATALIAIGFLIAKVSPNLPQLARGNFANAGVAGDDVFSTVRSVQSDDPSRVQISFDETRRRVVTGRIDDPEIQRYVEAAAREQNPAMRVESVGLLNAAAGGPEVRKFLLNTLAHDPIDEVRLKALGKLKPYAGDPEVRQTLQQSLLDDSNPYVRMQVMDLLVSHRDDAMVSVLQNLMQREENDAIRLKCEQALRNMKASAGTF
jgi:hypothetical protein